METLDELVCELVPKLKAMGYRKNKLTWYRNQEKLSTIFAIQKSQYGKNRWYSTYGVCLHEITEKRPNSISACQIIYRIDHPLTAEMILQLLKSWENRCGELPKLRRLAVEGQLPGIVTRDAIRYLTTVDVTKI